MNLLQHYINSAFQTVVPVSKQEVLGTSYDTYVPSNVSIYELRQTKV
jgi:hypothetical protein